jgi:hypothetical protein
MTYGRQEQLPVGQPRPELGRPSEFLMLVKTYPVPSKKYGETVCCAGIDAATEKWVRMYPVNFRSLAEYGQFNKWQFVQASWTVSADDSRPESRRIFQDTIRVGRWLSAGKGWAERRRWLDPLLDQSIEALRLEHLRTGKSLGVIRPRSIKRFIIQPTDPWDSESQDSLVQLVWTGPTLRHQRAVLKSCHTTSCTNSSARTQRARVTGWRSLTGS